MNEIAKLERKIAALKIAAARGSNTSLVGARLRELRRELDLARRTARNYR